MLVHGVIPSHAQDLSLPFSEIHEVPVYPFLQPDEIPLNGSTTTSIMPFTKMLNSIGPSVDPWGTPLVTGFQVDFMLVSTML